MVFTLTPQIVINPLTTSDCNTSNDAAIEEISRSLNVAKNCLNGIYINVPDRAISKIPKTISVLTNLESLDLNNNQLCCLPEEMGALSKLHHLLIRQNLLWCIPETIGFLVNLRVLILWGNQLTTLPDSICNLKKLEDLYLNHNKIEQLPDAIGEMVNLRTLNVANNALYYLPDSICKLSALQVLDLRHNFIALLPEKIGYLNVIDLDLSTNELTSLPILIGCFPGGSKLNLSVNRITALPIFHYARIVTVRNNPIPDEVKFIFRSPWGPRFDFSVDEGFVRRDSFVKLL